AVLAAGLLSPAALAARVFRPGGARGLLLRAACTVGLLAAALGVAGPASAQVPGGWKRVEIPSTGSYFLRYVPFNQDAGPMPVVIFLHGAGGAPEGYTGAVRAAAEQARVVLLLPKSATDLGWGLGEDEKAVDEALRLVSEELPVDRRHVAVAGHSAGGAY